VRNCSSCEPIWLGDRREDGLTPANVVDRVACPCCGTPVGTACGNEGTAPAGPKRPPVRWADVCPARVAWVTSQGVQTSLTLGAT
jgi:hypothetical protein